MYVILHVLGKSAPQHSAAADPIRSPPCTIAVHLRRRPRRAPGRSPSWSWPPAARPQQGGGFHGFPPADVTTIKLEPRTLPATYEYVGQTTGSKEVEVRARVTGILEKKLFQEGAPVKPGQVLFVIDPKPLEAQVAALEAEVARAQAQKAQAERELARLEAARRTARGRTEGSRRRAVERRPRERVGQGGAGEARRGAAQPRLHARHRAHRAACRAARRSPKAASSTRTRRC